MPTQRGLVPPAIIASTIALVVCSLAWGALGMESLTPAQEMTVELHRYLCIMLATVTICSMMVNLSARIVKVIREYVPTTTPTVCGYVEGYTDGLDAAPVSPAVTRLVPTRR